MSLFKSTDTTLILIGFTVIVILSVYLGMSYSTEGFRRLMPGSYPLSDDKPLLYDVYQVKPHPGVTKDGIENIYKEYPIQPANSVETTNYKYWLSPNNGTCVPSEICNGLYEDLPSLPKEAPLVPPNWSDKRLRVNFYNINY